MAEDLRGDALFTEGAVETWLKQLRDNARTVNDGEGEPLALKCEEALARLAQITEENTRLEQAVKDYQSGFFLRNQELESQLAQITEERDELRDKLAHGSHEWADACDCVNWNPTIRRRKASQQKSYAQAPEKVQS